MTESGLLEAVLDRLGSAVAAEAFSGADEAADWPRGALDAFLKNGLLRRAQPAQVIECRGCEENCFMPVHVFPAEGGRPARAFIACDRRDDVGRVAVDFRRLEQWQATGGMIAAALARLLEFSEPAPADGGQWHLGVLKGKKHNSPVVLMAGDNLMLSLAGHAVPLVDVLTIEENALALDKAALIRLVDNPDGNGEDPEARRARLKARVGEEKAKGTKAFLQVVADEEGISVSRLKQLTSAKPEPVNMWSDLAASPAHPSSKKIKPQH